MVSVRSATADDKNDVARVHVRSWQVGYRGLISDDLLGQMKAEDRAARNTFGEGNESSPFTIVATEDEQILGFVTLGASPDADSPNEGEIFALYVDPERWGQGVGRTLILSARTHLREMLFDVANLWVLEGNQRAIRFYEIDGWSSDGLSREEVVWGVAVKEIRLGRSLI
jgi:ribosomal protein S18 acetylase RimI-like enzyme